MAPPRIGELLVAEGLLPASALNRALGFQRQAAPRVKLGSILLTWDLIDESSLLRTLAALHRCEPVSGDTLAGAPVDVVRMLSATHAIRMDAIPYALEKSRVRVAFMNPSDLSAIDAASAVLGHACVPGVATELRILQAHRRFYGRPLPPELRPVIGFDASRISRASRAGVPVARPTDEKPPVRIPLEEEPPARPAAASAPVAVPEIPVPEAPGPTAAPEPAAPSALAEPPASLPEPEAAPMWMHAPREMPPPSAAVLGMWSPAAAPPPISEEEMGDLALSHVPSEFARVLLFAPRPGALAAWRARGFEAREVAGLRLEETPRSVFEAVRTTGTPHFGRVDPEMWPPPLVRLLEGLPPCAVFPVHAAGGVAALLYADRRGAPMKFGDTALLARAAAEIAALLAIEAPTRSAPPA